MKSPLPAPKFFPEQSFSSKKNKIYQHIDRPPPTPRNKIYGSSSSVSRLFSVRSSNSDRAQSISFQESKSSLSSKYDSNSDKLYFHQCFEIICKLGSGSFGEVFKVRCREDGKYYAVKRAKEKFSGKSDRERKLQEVQKHEELQNHPNCVRFYKAWEEKQHLYIQTELCSCSLSQYADKNHDIPEDIVWNYLIDLLLAVKHLHDHNLVHLDIKPDNIFISEEGVCKLGDFGLVLDLSKSDTTDAIEGDPRYIAPELMQGIFTKAADIFSLGITILELASDLDLPKGDDAWHQLRQLNIPQEFIEGLSVELTKVILLMMEPDHTKRPSVDGILHIEAIDKVYHKRKEIYKLPEPKLKFSTPKSYKSPHSDWSSSISDEVFDKDLSIIPTSLSNSESEKNKSVSRELLFYDSKDSSFDFSRAICLGMSTPSSFHYWDSNVHDTSGSPCLSGSKKKGLSPANDSPKFTKSPRLQLFNDQHSEEDLLNIPPKNLMNVFNSLSSEESQ